MLSFRSIAFLVALLGFCRAFPTRSPTLDDEVASVAAHDNAASHAEYALGVIESIGTFFDYYRRSNNARDSHSQATQSVHRQEMPRSVESPMQAPVQSQPPSRHTTAVDELRNEFNRGAECTCFGGRFEYDAFQTWKSADKILNSDAPLNSNITAALVHAYLQSRFLRNHWLPDVAGLGSCVACGGGVIYATIPCYQAVLPCGFAPALCGSGFLGFFGCYCASVAASTLPHYFIRRNFVFKMHDVIKSAVKDKLSEDLFREVLDIKYSWFGGGKELKQLAELFDAHHLTEASRYIRNLPEFYVTMSVYRGGDPALKKNGQDCAICLDEMDQRPHHEIVATTPPDKPKPKPRRFAQLDCSHEFHLDCIDEALRKTGPKCPLCRQNVLV